MSQDLLVSRELQELREYQDLRGQLGHQERKVLLENQVCLECQELMALLVTQERRDHLELKEIRVPAVLREPLAILALGALRELKESVV